MTRAQAAAKAAALTAAGVPATVKKNATVLGGYQTVTNAARRRNRAEQTARGNVRAWKAKHVASGGNTIAQREKREHAAAYAVEVFSPTAEKRISVPGARRVVVLSDIQIPFEDPAAVNEALDVVARVRPDVVVLNGDIVDCYAESSFLKDSDKALASIPESHVRARTLMASLQSVPTKIWLGGNHEDRWRRLLWSESPTALMLLRAHQRAAGIDIDLLDSVASFAKLFEMNKYGFAYYPYGHRLYFANGNLVVTHGKYVSRHSAHAAKRTWEWLGTSVIVGHTHRMGSYLITQDGHEAGAWENGCLCQLEPEYDDAPNWQQGFSVVHINGSEFHVVQVPIVRRGKTPVAVYHGGK